LGREPLPEGHVILAGSAGRRPQEGCRGALAGVIGRGAPVAGRGVVRQLPAPYSQARRSGSSQLDVCGAHNARQSASWWSNLDIVVRGEGGGGLCDCDGCTFYDVPKHFGWLRSSLLHRSHSSCKDSLPSKSPGPLLPLPNPQIQAGLQALRYDCWGQHLSGSRCCKRTVPINICALTRQT